MQFFVGFITGVLASMFTAGIRKMLAPTIFRWTLSVSKLCKCGLKGDAYWCIFVDVNVNSWWKLLAASLEDVEAVISYTTSDGNKESYKTTWVKPGTDTPSITLYIGGIFYGVQVAKASEGRGLLPLNGKTGKLFLDDQDIILDLICGRYSLGRWLYKDAIIKGAMQQVSPQKIKGSALINENEEEKSR